MRLLSLPLIILPWLVNTSLAQSDGFYDLEFDNTLYTRDSMLPTGYKTDLYKRSAEAMIDLLTDLADNPTLSRREAKDLMGGGGELVHSTANLISVLSNGCPTRVDPDYAECNYCRGQKKHKRSAEAKGGGGRGGGGKGGGGRGKMPMGLGVSGTVPFDCNGWKF